jgi:N-glycosylase/DNA lyase
VAFLKSASYPKSCMLAFVDDPGVDGLVRLVREAQSKPDVVNAVQARMLEFTEVSRSGSEKWFEELTYCLLTAYSSARMGYRCVAALTEENALLKGSIEGIRSCLREQGHRFADKRAEYIVSAREYSPNIKELLQSQGSSRQAREWLITNIMGLGMKEASHYLRNVGYFDLAIIDRHILSNMVELKIIPENPKSLTKNRYLRYEEILDLAAKKLGMPLGEMDLYLWQRKTGEVLK